MTKTKLFAWLFILVCAIFFLPACNNRHEDMQAQIDSLNTQMVALVAGNTHNEENKKLVAAFYQQLFGDKDLSAIDKYIGDTYIQHNPYLPDGKKALKQAAAQWFEGAPKEQIDIRHLSAEGDLVYIHTKGQRGPKAVSVVDIFRLEDGKIAEHWDVIQEVPEEAANSHPMF